LKQIVLINHWSIQANHPSEKFPHLRSGTYCPRPEKPFSINLNSIARKSSASKNSQSLRAGPLSGCWSELFVLAVGPTRRPWSVRGLATANAELTCGRLGATVATASGVTSLETGEAICWRYFRLITRLSLAVRAPRENLAVRLLALLSSARMSFFAASVHFFVRLSETVYPGIADNVTVKVILNNYAEGVIGEPIHSSQAKFILPNHIDRIVFEFGIDTNQLCVF
ncbi:MAG: hypothetical protein WA705_09445, partial [Candidatus Ozemobacteraceae bacterium]